MTVHEVVVAIDLNGDRHDLSVPTAELLIDTVRHRLGLTGTKLGCDQGACGACTVLVGADPAASCSTFTWQVDGASVTTIEGLVAEGKPSPEQAAFAEAGAFQCGYCTPGLIMSTAALLETHPAPDRATVIDWLDANICRCTGYLMVAEAVEDAARRKAGRA